MHLTYHLEQILDTPKAVDGTIRLAGTVAAALAAAAGAGCCAADTTGPHLFCLSEVVGFEWVVEFAG